MADVKIVIGATDNASRVLSGVRTSMAQAEKAAAAFGSALGLIGVAGIGGLVAIGRSAINAIDAFNDLKDATGSSIENISALDDVAARTGVSFDVVQTALIKLNKVLNDAKPDSETEQGLKAIGLSIKELKDLDPAEALLKVAQAFAGFADDSSKGRLQVQLLGKSTKELAPLLKDLAEKGKLVATVTTEQAEAAEKFNKEFSNLEKNANDAGRYLTVTLGGALNETIAAFKEGSAAGKSFFEIARGRVSSNINDFFGGAAADAIGYRKRLAEIDTQLQGGESRLLVRNALLREQGVLQGKIKAGRDDSAGGGRGNIIPALVDGRASLGGGGGGGTTGTKGPKGPDPDADFKRYMENLQKQIEKTQDLTAVEQLLADIEQGRLTVSPAEQAQVQARATALDLIKKTALASEERVKIGRGLTTDEGDAVNKTNQAYQDRIKTLLDNRPGAVLQKQRDDVLLLTKAFEDGRISPELYEEAIISRLDLVAEKTKDAKAFAQELGLTFASAFEDAIVDGKGLRDVLDGIGKDIARIIIRKQVTEPLANAIGGLGGSGGAGAGGGLGSFFSNLFSFSGGGSTGNGPRTGGLDGQGGFMAMLHPKETVIDHTKGRAAGGVTIVQNINIDSRSDQATIMAAMRQAADLAKQEIMRSRQSGGAFA